MTAALAAEVAALRAQVAMSLADRHTEAVQRARLLRVLGLLARRIAALEAAIARLPEPTLDEVLVAYRGLLHRES